MASLVENQIPIPHDFDVELTLINALITKNDLYFQIHEEVTEKDFLNQENAKAFAKIKELILSGKPVDKVILKGYLEKDSVIREKLSDEFKTAKEIKEYARILVDKRLRRELIMMGGEMMEDGMNTGEKSAKTILDKYKIRLSGIETNDDRFICESVSSACKNHEELMKERRAGSSGIKTGFEELDKYLMGGFKPGDFIIIGARPSVGKTCLATQFALKAAMEKKKSIFVTAEMSKEEIMDRILSMIGGFNPYDVCSGTVNEIELQKTYKILSSIDLKILELINGTSQNIISSVTKENLLNGVDIIFVDYLSYLRDMEGKLNETNRIGIITKNLKGLARDLKIPVVLVSQLNRNPEHRVDKIPNLSDLRDSGNLEQDADVVLLLHRKRRLSDNTLDSVTKLYVAKNRKGPTGEIDLVFDHKTLSFYSYGNLGNYEKDECIEE